MLVHVTRFTNVQRQVHAQVEDAVKRMKQRITRGIDHEGILAQLKKLWEEDFVPTCAEVALRVPEDGAPRIPSWKEILAALPDVLSDINVRIDRKSVV